MKKLLHFFILLPLLSFGQTGTNARFFSQSLVHNDTSIINNTDLKIYRLFDTRDSTHAGKSYYPFDGGVKTCNDNGVTIHYGPTNFIIKSNGIEVTATRDTICSKGITEYRFGGSRRIKQLKDGSVDAYYDLEKKYIKTQIGKIEVSPQQFHCDDTGNNPFRIERNGKSIYFKDGGNLLFFEYDSDNDGKKELFILNYHSCMAHIELYKIDYK
jgi:hypothetical protein